MRYQRLVKFPERRTGSYSCPNYRYGRCSRPLTITQDKVKAIVWQTVSDQLSICCDYETVVERLNNGDTTAKMEGYRSEIQSLSIQLNNRRDKRERLYEDFSDGILSPEEYMAMKKKYDAEYQEISAKLMDVQMRLMRLKKSLSGNNESISDSLLTRRSSARKWWMHWSKPLKSIRTRTAAKELRSSSNTPLTGSCWKKPVGSWREVRNESVLVYPSFQCG